jgi:hypothetical protein
MGIHLPALSKAEAEAIFSFNRALVALRCRERDERAKPRPVVEARPQRSPGRPRGSHWKRRLLCPCCGLEHPVPRSLPVLDR